MKNWSGNILFKPERVISPASVEEIKSALNPSGKVRALGSAHSFNLIADSKELMINFDAFPRDIEIDSSNNEVRVAAGVRYGELAIALNAVGLALPNMGSLPHITVVGATSTGTHGSGMRNQNLSAAISKIELISASGEEITFLDSDLDFARVALGALGVIHHITLRTIGAYQVAQSVYLDLPFENFFEHFAEVMGSGYSVSAFTKWDENLVDQLWIKSRIGLDLLPEEEFYSAKLAGYKVHPLAGADPQSATEQMGIIGPWHERLPHFRLDFTPSFGEELQSEYFVDSKDAVAALKSIHSLRHLIQPLLLISELRTVAADENWLSEAYGRDSLAIHFTWRPDVPGVMALLPIIESALQPFSARPHWGKLFTHSLFDFRSLYPKFEQWSTLRGEIDPERKFINEQLSLWGF